MLLLLRVARRRCEECRRVVLSRIDSEARILLAHSGGGSSDISVANRSSARNCQKLFRLQPAAFGAHVFYRLLGGGQSVHASQRRSITAIGARCGRLIKCRAVRCARRGYMMDRAGARDRTIQMSCLIECETSESRRADGRAKREQKSERPTGVVATSRLLACLLARVIDHRSGRVRR